MKIKGMYITEKYPIHYYMLELPDGTTKLVYMKPVRIITESDFWPCTVTPKQAGGQMVEPHTFQRYGLEKAEEGERK